MDLEVAKSRAIEAARVAGDIHLRYFGRLSRVDVKDKGGYVTDADTEAEAAIRKILLQDVTEIPFIGEETTGIPNEIPNDAWIVDPLDGTTNFVYSLPLFCVSIALWSKGQVVLGVIHAPILRETYVAVRGQGCTLNDQRVQVSHRQQLEDSLLVTGIVPENEQVIAEQLDVLSGVSRHCHGIRRLGAAAYDLCLVARGGMDLFWERNLKPWDSAAGLVIVKEAGGKVTTLRGSPYTPFCQTLVAGPSPLLDQFLGRVRPFLHSNSRETFEVD